MLHILRAYWARVLVRPHARAQQCKTAFVDSKQLSACSHKRALHDELGTSNQKRLFGISRSIL